MRYRTGFLRLQDLIDAFSKKVFNDFRHFFRQKAAVKDKSGFRKIVAVGFDHKKVSPKLEYFWGKVSIFFSVFWNQNAGGKYILTARCCTSIINNFTARIFFQIRVWLDRALTTTGDTALVDPAGAFSRGGNEWGNWQFLDANFSKSELHFLPFRSSDLGLKCRLTDTESYRESILILGTLIC